MAGFALLIVAIIVVITMLYIKKRDWRVGHSDGHDGSSGGGTPDRDSEEQQ